VDTDVETEIGGFDGGTLAAVWQIFVYNRAYGNGVNCKYN